MAAEYSSTGKRKRTLSQRQSTAVATANNFASEGNISKNCERRRRQLTEEALIGQLSQRMPFVYAIAIVNIFLVSYMFYGTVTDLHLGLASVPLLTIAGLRSAYWHPRFAAKRSAEKISRDLRQLPWLGTAVAAGLMVFGLSLYPFGSPEQQSLIHYLATLTCFTGILGLSPSPRTAFGMLLVSVIPSVTVFLFFGHENAWAVSIAMVSVSGLLLVIARVQYLGFLALIDSRATILVREEETDQLNQMLHNHAYFDDLTSIANRRSFLEKFDAILQMQDDQRCWLGLVDLDGFKLINDLHGHRAGDEILKATADRISSFAEILECGRLGGDEFAFLMSTELTEQQAVERSCELASLISKPFEHGVQQLSVSCSIGLRRTEGLTSSECIERADWALYKAKEDGSGVTVFSHEDELIMQDRAKITKLFDSADLANQLKVVYQPIFDYDTNNCESIEILARWQLSNGTVVLPNVFIPLAESTHRTSELTKIIIRKSLRQLPPIFKGKAVHINLSVKDIADEKFIRWLKTSDAFSTVPRTQVVLELTETAILTGGDMAIKILQDLREFGFRIALDDFGVGQSSLSRIHKLPLDQIKIDKSFCSEDYSSQSGWSIIATILSLSRQIGIECVLEGIETEEQAIKARSLGVRLMQGYYFSRPKGAEEFEDCCQIGVADATKQTVSQTSERPSVYKTSSPGYK